MSAHRMRSHRNSARKVVRTVKLGAFFPQLFTRRVLDSNIFTRRDSLFPGKLTRNNFHAIILFNRRRARATFLQFNELQIAGRNDLPLGNRANSRIVKCLVYICYVPVESVLGRECGSYVENVRGKNNRKNLSTFYFSSRAI